MRLSGQFLIFLRKILQYKNCKTSNFYSLKSFCAQKNFAFCCFLFTYFCFVGWFLLVFRFLCCRIFLKKIRNCPHNLIYYTTCDICHYWYFLNYSFKFQPYVCNRCHNLLMISMNISDIGFGSDYCCIISLTNLMPKT